MSLRIGILADARNTHTRRIATAAAERGCQVTIVSHKEAHIAGVNVIPFAVPPLSLAYPGRWTRRRDLFLRRFLVENEVIHINFLHDWFLTPELLAGVPLIVTPWGSDIVKPPDLDAYPQHLIEMRQWLLRRADRIMAYGRAFGPVIAEFGGINPADVVVVPLGVDTNLFRRRRPAASNNPVIGFLKGFKAVYGPDVWVRAIPRVARAFPDARFDMIGGGPLLDECQDYVSEKGLGDRVRWRPPQPHEELPGLMADWSLSVMPSICESFGAAALESAAMEIPVVGTDVCGFRETVRDLGSGVLVPPGDVETLAEAVIDLLSDTQRRAELGRVGRSGVTQHYEWHDCIDQLMSLYQSVAAGATCGSAL